MNWYCYITLALSSNCLIYIFVNLPCDLYKFQVERSFLFVLHFRGQTLTMEQEDYGKSRMSRYQVGK